MRRAHLRGIAGRRAGRLAAVLGLAVLGTAGLSGTAFAGNGGADGNSFVDGGGALTDDWGDHYGELGHSLCNGCAHSKNTDLVLMWQAVLFADELLQKSDLDGQFGPRTEAATRKWQARYGVGVDGQVGNQTWSRADDMLEWGTPNTVLYINRYQGTVTFTRGDSGNLNGAYELFGAAPNGAGDASADFRSSGHRVQFYSRTVTVS
ncbi:hypothetical protein GCM10020229_31740 [Kitasatospora albolonga]|uniref:peptidoglycan-binding domain-containing protein n=1 Tax=Kitasatospora albolonga TaxID=68173 RepID=UPI0031E6FA7E